MDKAELRTYIKSLALKLQGCPYIWGGQDPWTGMDCSGFVIWVLQTFHLLPAGDWTAQGLYNNLVLTSKPITVVELGPGDLVFYGPRESAISHIMLGLAPNLVVGASGGDHTTTTFEAARLKGAKVKVKTPNYRNDLVYCLRISGLDDGDK